METRKIWMRLGITLTGTKEEIEALFDDNFDTSKNALMKMLTNGDYNFDGDSYIPETCVEDYNDKYKTNHEVGDYGFTL